MSVKITYVLSEKGQRESLKEGGDGKKIQDIVVERESPLFGRAVSLGVVNPDGSVVLDLTQHSQPTKPGMSVSVDQPLYDGPADIGRLVDDYERLYVQAEQRHAEKVKGEAEKRVKKALETLETDPRSLLSINHNPRPNEPDYFSVRDDTGQAWVANIYRPSDFAIHGGGPKEVVDAVLNDPRVIQLREKLRPLCDELNQAECKTVREKVNSRNAELAIEREKKLAEKAEWEGWVQQHGSPRLKRLLQEGIEYRAVYLDERLAVERPGWRFSADVEGQYYEPRNVPAEAFSVLDEARKLEPEAELVYWTVENDASDPDYEDGEPSKFRWTGYAAVAKFLDEEIVFGGPDA